MKLLISSAGPLDGFIGGGQVYVQNLARELQRRQWDFTIVSPDEWTGDATQPFLVQWRQWEGIRVAGVAINPAMLSAGDRWSNLSAAQLDALRIVVDALQPEVMHLNGLKAPLVAIAREREIPCLVTVHHGGIACPAGALLRPDDTICDKPMDSRWCVACYCRQLPGGGAMGRVLARVPPVVYRPLGRALNQLPHPGYAARATMYPWLVEQMIPAKRLALLQADRYIAPSRAVAQVLIRNGTPEDKITVMPHGINPLPFNSIEGLGQRPLRFGYVGQIARHKGLHVLCAAFARLPEKLQCELHIIGAAQRPGEDDYLKRCLQLCAGRRVVAHGSVPPERMGQAMGWFDVLVHSAIFFEVFGLVVAEALSAGRPVIATRCGGPEDQIENGVNGLLVPPNDVAALAGAMRKLAETPGLVAQLAAGIRPVRTLGQHADDLERLLISCAAGKAVDRRASRQMAPVRKTRRLRIAFDVTPLLYDGGGIRRCTESLLNALWQRENGFDLVPFGRRLLGGSFQFEKSRRRYARLRLPRLAEPLIRTLGLVEMACRADLYHATDFYIPLRSAQRGIATIHDVIFLRNPQPGVDHPRLAKWAGEFAAQSNAVITCSQWSKDDLTRLLGIDAEKVHVIYWGVDHDRFFPERDDAALRRRLEDTLQIRRPYFLAVSCSMHRKNTPRLLRAYARLLSQGAANDLVLAWDAPREIRRRYETQVQQGRVRFLGRVDDSLLRDLYAGATAALYPSLDEGFGLPLLEAMTCGTPVITANGSCLPEIGGDAAIYVDPLCEQSMAGAMARFENRDPRLIALRQRGIDRAAAFTWARCAEQTVDVYRQALQGF